MPLENHHAFGAPTGFYWSSQQHELTSAPTFHDNYHRLTGLQKMIAIFVMVTREINKDCRY